MDSDSYPTPLRTTENSAVDGGTTAVAKATPYALSLVIPCYNEQGVIETLAQRLSWLEEAIRPLGAIEFLFVDDGSGDATLEEIERFARPLRATRILRHGQNQGLAAAMMTGIREASSELVGVVDADCTYDPSIMLEMLPCMTAEVAAVTASPYHRDGEVVAVPPWRLKISQAASTAYRFAFRQKLATYTSCCRIYRKQQVGAIQLSQPGFVGVTELLWRIDRAGGKVVEHPARLSSRVLGHSKLRVVRTAFRHATFLAKALFLRTSDLFVRTNAP